MHFKQDEGLLTSDKTLELDKCEAALVGVASTSVRGLVIGLKLEFSDKTTNCRV